jgi:hypothetical protein
VRAVDPRLRLECRLFAGEDMIATQVCRNDAEIEAFRKTWCEALTLKGWS